MCRAMNRNFISVIAGGFGTGGGAGAGRRGRSRRARWSPISAAEDRRAACKRTPRT